MRFGYSLRDRVAQAAEEITYEATRERQVVCPSCKEPVIKVVRTGKTAATHFLKHFAGERDPIERAKQVRCELRTSWMDKAQVTAMAREGEPRGQSIDAFLSTFDERMTAAAAALTGRGTSQTREYIANLKGHPGFGQLAAAWTLAAALEGPCTAVEAIGYIDEIRNQVKDADVGTAAAPSIAEFIRTAEAYLANAIARRNLKTFQACMLLFVEAAPRRMGDMDGFEEGEKVMEMNKGLSTFIRTMMIGAKHQRALERLRRLGAKYVVEVASGVERARTMKAAERDAMASKISGMVARANSRIMLSLVPFAHMLPAQEDG